MNKCPNCEYHKESARMWRQKAYTLSVHPLNDEQEPVAYKYTDKHNPLVFYFTERKGKDVTQNPDVIETALYTAPPIKPWVGLHLDDIPETYAGDKSFLNIAKWAEAKLKEKNT